MNRRLVNLAVLIVTGAEGPHQALFKKLEESFPEAQFHAVAPAANMGLLLARHHPKVVLCDLETPQVDIRAVVDAALSVDPGMRVVALGRSASSRDVVRAMSHGARDLVSDEDPVHMQLVMAREMGILQRWCARNTELLSQFGEMQLGHAILDHGRIASCDDLFAELLGAEAAALQGTPILQYVDGEDHHKVRAAVKEAGEGKGHAAQLFSVIRANGERAVIAMAFGVQASGDKPALGVSVRRPLPEEAERSGKLRPGRILSAALVNRIKNALKDNTLALAMQPISELASEGGDEVHRLDVLVRLKDAEGELAARDFIQEASAAGLVRLIDRWVVRATCQLIGKNARNSDRMLFFLRLSRQSLQEPVTLIDIQADFRGAGVSAEHFSFELTETDLAELADTERQNLEGLRKLGCVITVSRVGGHPKALELMRSLKPDYVKLDAKLTDQAQRPEGAPRRLLDLLKEAKSLKIRTISTQVADAATFAALWNLGVHYAQGHYVREPEIVMQGERG